MIKKALLGLAIISTSLLYGCASVPMASPEADAKAKQFPTTEGRANVYIYRNENMGAAIKMPILMDGFLIGDTAANTYILKEVTPGEHEIVSKTENDAKLTVNAVGGKNYYVWQEVKMGTFAARSKLHLVDEKQGQKAVKECKLIK